MRPRVFIDTETTGLDPAVHEAYEVAWAVGDGPIQSMALPHSLSHANPESLEIGNYWARGFKPLRRDVYMWRLGQLAYDLTDVTLVAANPAFDAAFLRKTLGYAPWHYRLLDVETYAMAVFRWDEPRGLHGITEWLRELRHDIPLPDHSATGDVATLRAAWSALEAHR